MTRNPNRPHRHLPWRRHHRYDCADPQGSPPRLRRGRPAPPRRRPRAPARTVPTYATAPLPQTAAPPVAGCPHRGLPQSPPGDPLGVRRPVHPYRRWWHHRPRPRPGRHLPRRHRRPRRSRRPHPCTAHTAGNVLLLHPQAQWPLTDARCPLPGRAGGR
eukprot:5098990-Prymnesium_polylepis.1